MTIKLVKASIIIIAEAHNPSIISPDWLKGNNIISEDPKQFIHTPDFSVFETAIINIVLDRQRLQITLKKLNNKNLQYIMNIAKNYVKLLPHIPYKQLGINFDWLIEKFDEEKLPQIKPKIGSITSLDKIIDGDELAFGLKIIAKNNPYTLKLTIDPASENALICKFNYHHEINELKDDIIIEYLDKLTLLYNNSKGITENISIGENPK